jgi:glycogen debranching enzyme
MKTKNKTIVLSVAVLMFTALSANAVVKPVDPRIPEPVLEKSPRLVELYWKAWEISLTKTRKPRPGSGFVSEYMDEGFSDNIFQWDTCFMVMFGRYAQDVVPAAKSFDNFYAKQHTDGFIDREIHENDGTDMWGPTHNNAINPPLYSWVEWENYMINGDTERLKRVYPYLKKYYGWIKEHRGLPSGMYWTTNLASGMDNSPRIYPDGDDSGLSYGYTWVDLTAQQAMNAMYLSRIANISGLDADAAAFQKDYDDLNRLVNENFWDSHSGMYYDLNAKGKRTKQKTVASFWPMLANIAPPDRAKQLVERHLKNTKEFWRPHPFPTASRDNILYDRGGGYWKGSVWAPTEYMIIRGLLNYGYDDFAADAVERHLKNMSDVLRVTGTIWENYAPEFASRGNASAGNFVGWSGVGPIAMLIENIIGLRADAPADTLTWRIRRTDRHGMKNFHFGDNKKITLIADSRAAATDPVTINITSDSPFKLIVDLPQGKFEKNVVAGANTFTLP